MHVATSCTCTRAHLYKVAYMSGVINYCKSKFVTRLTESIFGVFQEARAENTFYEHLLVVILMATEDNACAKLKYLQTSMQYLIVYQLLIQKSVQHYKTTCVIYSIATHIFLDS